MQRKIINKKLVLFLFLVSFSLSIYPKRYRLVSSFGFMEISSVNTTAALASLYIAFGLMFIGVLVVIAPAGTIMVQEAQAQQQEQQIRKEAPTEATKNMPDGPSEILAADDHSMGRGDDDDIAPDADNEVDTVTVCIDVPPNQITQEVTLGEAQFLEETIPESELSYGECDEGG
jgi:multidrug efflux pump subunit AcrA (membrane-fusion protein)